MSWAVARPGPSNFGMLGRGPAESIASSKFHGPARPGPSILQKRSARTGPADHKLKIGLARPGLNSRRIASPVLLLLSR